MSAFLFPFLKLCLPAIKQAFLTLQSNLSKYSKPWPTVRVSSLRAPMDTLDQPSAEPSLERAGTSMVWYVDKKQPRDWHEMR